MTPRMQFATLRLLVVTFAVLAQLYLFVRIGQAIQSWQRSDVFKSRAIRIVGLAILVLFVTNVYIMLRPIPWVYPPTAAQLFLFYPPAIWTCGSIFSALFLFLIRGLAGTGRKLAELYGKLAGRTFSQPLDLGRRRFLRAGMGGLAAAPLILSGYGAAYASRDYEIRTLNLPFGHPLTVVQLSDIHAGLYMNREQMRRYADQVTALQPDLFVLTGDYISNSKLFLPGCLEEMARVRTRYGIFATLGNHEHWHENLEQLQANFRKYGIILLQNAHQVIRTEQGRFAVAGIDDLMAGRPDLEAALSSLEAGVPTILLSHRPEIFPQAAARGVSLTLAGHYHGGQLKLSLPGVDISLAHLRSRYPEGLYRIAGSRLYVNRGIGTTFTPVRLNAPPEITRFILA